jgi:GNAT superfamily N-acetyltransferase
MGVSAGSLITCRPAHPEELPSLAAFAQRIFAASVAPAYTAEGVETFSRYADAPAMSARQGNHRLVVAEVGTTLVGLLELRDESHVAMLFVESAYQRQGIGRALLRAAFGPETDWPPLTVNSAPGAEGAYERLGFVATGPEEERNGMRYLPMRRAGLTAP